MAYILHWRSPRPGTRIHWCLSLVAAKNNDVASELDAKRAGKTARIPIKIDPGMAFGTGTHPTTQLCLELMEMWFDQSSVVNRKQTMP